jgi:parvulin-like peptidyl-prolyl isomerase
MNNTIQQNHLTLGGGSSTARALLLWAILSGLMAVPVVGLLTSGAWSAVPEVVALVNGEPVTRRELQRVLADRAMRRRMKQELGVQEPDIQELERLALRKLINRSLILQEAGRREFTVTEQELNRRVVAFRRRFKDAKRLAAWMKARGLDDNSLREGLRNELLMTRVRAALVEGVRLTDEQVQEYYEAHQDDLKTAEEVRLRIIAVRDKTTADEIMTALKKGEDFARLARERSLESRAAQGGDTGWVVPRTLPPPLRETVGTLKAGETGGPVQTDDDFLLVRLEERKPVRTMSQTEARPEIEARLLPTRREEVFQAWLTEQEKQSKIEVFLQPTGSDSAISLRPGRATGPAGSELSASETDVSIWKE